MALLKNTPKGTALILCILFYATAAGGCRPGKARGEMRDRVDMNSVKKITYRFIDASVPPKYHRSYTITVSESIAHIVVDSYGNILVEKDSPISKRQFNDLLNTFQQSRIYNCKRGEDRGCTGGTGEKISLNDGGEEIFDGWVYHCGGENYGNLCGNVAVFAAEVKKMVPELGRLVK